MKSADASLTIEDWILMSSPNSYARSVSAAVMYASPEWAIT